MAATADPKIGDVVRLKSGGPKMTVVDVDGPRVTCCWRPSDEHEVQKVIVPPAAVESASGDLTLR